MKHVMVDLETLGTRAGCKVLSIGAVTFDEHGVGFDKFYIEIDRHAQATLWEDPDTVVWWGTQPAVVRERLFNDDSKETLTTALDRFETWLCVVAGRDKRGKPDVCVWGNGADFDNAILHAAFSASFGGGPSSPWDHWNNRCYRTLKNLLPEVKAVRVGALHNALDDAVTQAEHAVRLLLALGVWTSSRPTSGISVVGLKAASQSPSLWRKMWSRLRNGRDIP